jgi:CHASE3 domain sensor protein
MVSVRGTPIVAGSKWMRFWEFLEQGLLRELGVPALAASLVLFVSAMTLLGANVSALRAAYAQVQQTNQALLELSMVNVDILRIEMTVRGYALSGDANYLKWQTMAEDGLDIRLATLQKLVVDDADEVADIAKLRTLLASHRLHFRSMAKLVPTNRDRVIAEMVDYSKKVKRRPIENLLIDMRDDETRQLAAQQHDAETRVVAAYRYAIGISSIALVLGAIGFALILSDRRARRRRN